MYWWEAFWDGFYWGLALGIPFGGALMWWYREDVRKRRLHDESREDERQWQLDDERRKRAPYLPFSLIVLEHWARESPTLRAELTRLHEKDERDKPGPTTPTAG